MKQLDPKAVWMFFIQQSYAIPVLIIPVILLLSAILPVLTLNSSTANAGRSTFQILATPVIAILILVAMLVLAYIWAYLNYHFYRYELTPNGFKKESGVIYKKYVTIPYEKIQNVDIHRNLLARLLGLSDLQIQTAGNSGGGYSGLSEGRLPGLSVSEAEVLRDELINRSKTVQPHI